MGLYVIPVVIQEPSSGVHERTCPLAPEVVTEAGATGTSLFAIFMALAQGNIVATLEKGESTFDLKDVRLSTRYV